MTVLRLVSRVAMLSLGAAAFVGLTEIYAASARYRVPGPHEQEARRSRPLRPQANELPSIAGEGVLFALYAATGRIIWSRVPRTSRGGDDMIRMSLRPSGRRDRQV